MESCNQSALAPLATTTNAMKKFETLTVIGLSCIDRTYTLCKFPYSRFQFIFLSRVPDYDLSIKCLHFPMLLKSLSCFPSYFPRKRYFHHQAGCAVLERGAFHFLSIKPVFINL